ncbi:hypothetical protein A2U01_0111906, partial [Trifolium medium]|nr:hypothetical protein [Trifolium medium]
MRQAKREKASPAVRHAGVEGEEGVL